VNTAYISVLPTAT